VNGREVASSGEWAQHFSNASCLNICQYDLHFFLVNYQNKWEAMTIFCLNSESKVYSTGSQTVPDLLGQLMWNILGMLWTC